MHYVVFGSGQDSGTVYGVFGAYGKAVEFCEFLIAEFHDTGTKFPRIGDCTTRLTVEAWEGSLHCDDIADWAMIRKSAQYLESRRREDVEWKRLDVSLLPGNRLNFLYEGK